MTLLSVQNALIQLLTQQDTISPADFHRAPIPKELEDRRDQMVRAVLADLVTAGMLRPLTAPTEAEPSLWILTAPIGSSGQEVSLSLETAVAVADEINAFRDAFGMEREWPEASALQIGEHNILMLMDIIGRLRAEDPNDPDFGGGTD